jgi:hypothetical protein
MPWGAAIGAAASLVGSSMQAGAASDAAAAQQKKQTTQQRKDSAPWRLAGGAAIETLASKLGLASAIPGGYTYQDFLDYAKKNPGKLGGNTPEAYAGAAFDNYKTKADSRWYGDDKQVQSWLGKAPSQSAAASRPDDFGELNRKFTVADFYADPVTELGLQFGLDEGRKGITRMAGARGNRDSGETLKALTKFGTDYTGTKAGESYLRFVNDQTNIYNRLAGVAGTGQNAANTTGQLGQAGAQNISNMYTAQGNARGAASIAQGNAYGQGFGNIGNYYNQQQTLDKILNRGTGSVGYTGGYGGQDLSQPDFSGGYY